MAAAGTIPVWLTGVHITTVTIEALDIDSSGNLTDTVTGYLIQKLYGSVNEIRYSGILQTRQLTPLTSVRQNAVPMERDDALTVSEFLKARDDNAYSATNPQYNILAKAWERCVAATPQPYARFIFTRGGNTVTYIGLIKSYQESPEKTGGTGSMAFVLVDPGAATANPAYA